MPRYLALGDSYTVGEGVPHEACWPVQLARTLRLDAPHIVATTGWSTGELAAGIDAAALAPPYDLVSLLIGVNDHYRGGEVDTYAEAFKNLLERAVALAGGDPRRVLVVSIPDWGVTPFAGQDHRSTARIAVELDRYNAIGSAAAVHAGAHFVDITGISRAHSQLVAADGLHPSASQYALWTDVIAPVARGMLMQERR